MAGTILGPSDQEQRPEPKVIKDGDKEEMGLADDELGDIIHINLQKLNSNDSKRKEKAAKTIENKHEAEELSLSDIK